MQLIESFRRSAFIVCMLSMLLLLPWLFGKEFSSRGESREALNAQRMMLSGDYILPAGYDDAVPSKPPVLHWLIVGFSRITGEVTEGTARLPSAIGSVIFLLCLQVFLSRRGYVAWLPPMLLLTATEWFRASTTARVDGLLAMFFAGALLAMYGWYERGFKGVPILSVVLLGCAALTKGPIGILLPMAAFSSFLLLQRVSIKKVFLSCVALTAPATIIALTWYIAAYYTDGPRFLDTVYHENIARFTGTMSYTPHNHSIFYLYGSLLLGFMPWTLLPLLLIVTNKKSLSFTGVKEVLKKDRFLFFCAVVLFCCLLFFSIPDSKRSTYLLPAYPFAAILMSEYVLRACTSKLAAIRSIGIFAAIFTVALCISLIVVCFVPVIQLAFLTDPLIRALQSSANDHEKLYMTVIAVNLIVGSALLIKISTTRGRSLLWVIALSFYLPFFLVHSLVVAPVANALSYRSFSEETQAMIANEEKLYSFEDAFYGVSFYLKKQFYSVVDSEMLQEGRHLYLFERNLEDLKAMLPSHTSIQVLARSTKNVVKKDQHVILVKVVPGE